MVRTSALDFGAAIATQQDEAHAAKVRKLIEDQTLLNPDAPRLIYGRGHTAEIKVYEAAVNAAALPLLKANPRLISFCGGRVQSQALINAAKVSTTPTPTPNPTSAQAEPEDSDDHVVRARVARCAGGGECHLRLRQKPGQSRGWPPRRRRRARCELRSTKRAEHERLGQEEKAAPDDGRAHL